MNYPTNTDNAAEATTYNGWKNHATWSIALWMMNDEDNYDLVKASDSYNQFMNAKSYEQVMMVMMGDSTTTPDGAAWNDKGLDYEALDELVMETN